MSISLRGAATAAMDTAQIILMDQSLNQLGDVFDLARKFDTNIKTCWITTIAPGLLCVGGVFFLRFGIFSSIMLYNLSLVAGVSNAMLPWLSYKALQHKKRTLASPLHRMTGSLNRFENSRQSPDDRGLGLGYESQRTGQETSASEGPNSSARWRL